MKRVDQKDMERPVCRVRRKNERKEMQKQGGEGQGRAEACVIVLPLSFDPARCSCCCLEHLCFIRGKWVVRGEERGRTSFILIFLSFSLFCTLIPSLDLSLLCADQLVLSTGSNWAAYRQTFKVSLCLSNNNRNYHSFVGEIRSMVCFSPLLSECLWLCGAT